MVASRALPTDRPAVGQLLVGLLREFRTELFAPAAEHGYADLREPHLQVFGNLGGTAVRLTDLAARAQLSLATTSELVSDLERLGYLERREDPSDGRAKLIHTTNKGKQALRDAAIRVAEIETHWAQLVGRKDFDHAFRVLAHLLSLLRPEAWEPTASR